MIRLRTPPSTKAPAREQRHPEALPKVHIDGGSTHQTCVGPYHGFDDGRQQVGLVLLDNLFVASIGGAGVRAILVFIRRLLQTYDLDEFGDGVRGALHQEDIALPQLDTSCPSVDAALIA